MRKDADPTDMAFLGTQAVHSLVGPAGSAGLAQAPHVAPQPTERVLGGVEAFLVAVERQAVFRNVAAVLGARVRLTSCRGARIRFCHAKIKINIKRTRKTRANPGKGDEKKKGGHSKQTRKRRAQRQGREKHAHGGGDNRGAESASLWWTDSYKKQARTHSK